VAFIKRMPQMTASAYAELALGSVRSASQDGKALATVESDQQSTGACARCHGAEAEAPTSALVPRLHGQPAEFLANSLKEYASGVRRSGIMQPLAAPLGSEDIHRLADYYARLPPLKQHSAAPDKSLLERGRQLATVGDPANGVPACNTCHGREALARYPRLAGQSALYMTGQLQLWRAGHHAATDGGAIMAPIARRLSDHDMAAVTAYLASLAAEPAATGRP